MKKGMSDLRFFDLLYLNWMENPKEWLEKEKKWAVLAKNSKKWPNFGIFDQNVNFLTTYGHKIKKMALSVKF